LPAQRIEILQLVAAKNSGYIQVSDWESKREEYKTTLEQPANPPLI